MESIASLHRAPLQRTLPAEMAGGFARANQSTAQAIAWKVAALAAGQDADAFGRPDLNTLVGVIYDGLADRISWMELLGRLRGPLAVDLIVLTVRAPGGSDETVMIGSGSTRPIPAIGADPLAALRVDQVEALNDLSADPRFADSTYHRTLLAPADLNRMLAVNIRTEDGTECRLRLCRDAQADPFDAREEITCSQLLPHLKRALALCSTIDLMESERRLYSSAMDRLMVGAIILDEAGRVLRTTGLADTLLAEKDGLKIINGCLHAAYPADDVELQRRVKDVARRPGGSGAVAASIGRPSGVRNLGIVIQRIGPNDRFAGIRTAAVALFIRDPERKPEVKKDMLRQLFDLTPAESALAILLTDGLSLEEAAVELDISRNTARAHLRSIFSKMLINRQSELVSILLSSAAALGGAGQA